jgi:Xaa-Pro aminopeptidase
MAQVSHDRSGKRGLRLINADSSDIIPGVNIVAEKIAQAGRLLDELNIDLWLIFARETTLQSDPAMPLVVGDNVTWQSFFLYSRGGDAIALVGNLDVENFKRGDRFTEVIAYTEGVGRDIRALLERLDPRAIALNYSVDDPASDGLTHGMYLQLCGYLEDTPYRERLVSAETFCTKLRSRKTQMERDRLTAAATLANDAWLEAVRNIEAGMTEIDIAGLIDMCIAERGAASAFPTLVNAGDKTVAGHGHPTSARLEPGDLLHVDFGARVEDYCSDIQRLLYIPRRGESAVPRELSDAFDMVSAVIKASAETCRPGAIGHELDAAARRMLLDNGYPEYQHALGHQLGRSVHDGGGIIGPRWERYGITPTLPLEPDSVFTLELEIVLPGIGCVGLEEDVCVTESGGRFLSPRQLELIAK